MQSKYGAGEISEAQYLAEITSARRVRKTLNIKDVPDKFWNMPEFRKIYATEVMAANGLLRIYPLEVLLNVINSKSLQWIYTLNMKRVKEEAEIQMRVYERNIKVKESIAEKKVDVVEDKTNIVPTVIVLDKDLSTMLD